MSLAQLIPLALTISLWLVLFSVALQASPGDLTYLLRRPSLLVRSLLAMNVVMPVVATLIAKSFDLLPEVKVALILLAVSPVPPILPKKERKAGGNVSYAIGLLALSGVVSIVTVPVTMAIIGRLFGQSIHVPPALIARTIGISIVFPLLAGGILMRLTPSLAQRLAPTVAKVGTATLVLAFIPVLIKAWPAIVAEIGNFTLLAIVLFTLLSLAVGHALGGPAHEDRTVLALSTASRHPGVAIAIAGAAAAAENKPAVSAAVLLAFLVATVVTGPYAKSRKRVRPAVVLPAR